MEDLSSLHHLLKAKLEQLDEQYAPIKAEYAKSRGKAKVEEYTRLRAERQKVSEDLIECEEARDVSDLLVVSIELLLTN